MSTKHLKTWQDDRPQFEASALEPVRPPDVEEGDDCRHAGNCGECGAAEIWIHDSAGLIGEWADTVFRLTNTPSLGDDFALAAIRPIAVALARQASSLVDGTRGSFAAKPSLKAVSADPED